MLDDDLDLFLAAALANQALMNLVRSEFEADGLVLAAWGLLVHVASAGNATPSQLAAETGVTATTIRDQVQSLVDRGLLRRRPNPDDSRSYRLELTPAGRRALVSGRRAADRANASLAAGLDLPLADVKELLLRLRDAARSALG